MRAVLTMAAVSLSFLGGGLVPRGALAAQPGWRQRIVRLLNPQVKHIVGRPFAMDLPEAVKRAIYPHGGYLPGSAVRLTRARVKLGSRTFLINAVEVHDQFRGHQGEQVYTLYDKKTGEKLGSLYHHGSYEGKQWDILDSKGATVDTLSANKTDQESVSRWQQMERSQFSFVDKPENQWTSGLIVFSAPKWVERSPWHRFRAFGLRALFGSDTGLHP